MAAWQTPVFDRTAEELAARAGKCCFSARLLNRIEGNTQVLAERFGVRGLSFRQWRGTDFLTPAQMQRILQNLAAVRAAYHVLPGSPPVPALPATHWQDVNDIEAILWGLDMLWQRNAARLKIYAGELCAGDGIGVI